MPNVKLAARLSFRTHLALGIWPCSVLAGGEGDSPLNLYHVLLVPSFTPLCFLVSRLAKNQAIIIFTGFPRGAKENACSDASVAQLVEQLICNQQVMGSSPFAGSSFFGFVGDRLPFTGCLVDSRLVLPVALQGGARGVGDLARRQKRTGELPKRSKGTDCKSVGLAPSKVRILHSPLQEEGRVWKRGGLVTRV